MEQLVFLAILYAIGVGIYRFVKWANQQISGSNAPGPIQQAIGDAQRQAQGSPAGQTPRTQPLSERRLSSARPVPRQPEAGGPAVPNEATSEDFQRREQELQAESDRAYAYFRQRAEALRAEREGLINSPPPIAAQPDEPVLLAMAQPPSVPIGLLEAKDDLVRAFIVREALAPPLSRRSSSK